MQQVKRRWKFFRNTFHNEAANVNQRSKNVLPQMGAD